MIVANSTEKLWNLRDLGPRQSLAFPRQSLVFPRQSLVFPRGDHAGTTQPTWPEQVKIEQNRLHRCFSSTRFIHPKYGGQKPSGIVIFFLCVTGIADHLINKHKHNNVDFQLVHGFKMVFFSYHGSLAWKSNMICHWTGWTIMLYVYTRALSTLSW